MFTVGDPFTPVAEEVILAELKRLSQRQRSLRLVVACMVAMSIASWTWFFDPSIGDWELYTATWLAGIGIVLIVATALWRACDTHDRLLEKMSEHDIRRIRDEYIGERGMLVNLAKVQMRRDVYYGDWRGIVAWHRREARIQARLNAAEMVARSEVA